MYLTGVVLLIWWNDSYAPNKGSRVETADRSIPI